jgi:hypothetical protein
MNEVTKGICEILQSIMPPEQLQAYQEQRRKEDERDLQLVATLRTACYDAIERITFAMRTPRIAESDLDEAIALLTTARDCAKALDR